MNRLKQLFFISLCSSMISLQSIEKLKSHPAPKNHMTLYAWYMVVREFVVMNCVFPFKVDLKKIQQSSIFCDRCNNKMSLIESYANFAARARDDILVQFKKLFYAGDFQAVLQYLCQINIQEEYECIVCMDYWGWHI